MEQDQEQRKCREQRRRIRQSDHDEIYDTSSRERPCGAFGVYGLPSRGAAAHARAIGHSCRRHAFASRLTCHTSHRAMTFTMIVMANSTPPTAMSAETCRSDVASLNSFAISDAML